MFKKIVIPLDGSDNSEAVIPFAAEIASRTGGELVLVTAVQQVGVWDATMSMQALDRENQVATEYLETKRAEVANLGANVSTKLAQGDAADAVLRTADEVGADLLAMTTQGRSGIARWLFGSVASRLVGHAKIPVLVIRPKEGEDKGAPGPVVKKILVPLDGSEVALSILPVVEDFARTMGASVVLFTAVAPLAAYPGFETAGAAAIGEVIADLQKQAEETMAMVASEVKGRGIEASYVVALDTAVDGTCRAADELGVDLIAIATHGRGGLGRVVLGSVADGVIRRSADVPVLVVRPTDSTD
ncbi:MAG TPA: universal stress protein [Dehalococcoidia bacterium]|nr:universal stress protein [Dehalococcoidia bacterium]